MAKGNPRSLEEIATLLLKGKLGCEEAAVLSKNFSIPLSVDSENEYRVVQREEGFRVVDSRGKIKSYANFYPGMDPFGSSFLRITGVESYDRFNGDASLLFGSLFAFAKQKKIEYILAEVDRENDEAINVLNREGFYPVGEIEACGLNIEREIVRKDISI